MRQFIIKLIILLSIIINLASCTSIPPSAPLSSIIQADKRMVQGLALFNQGEFAQAVHEWQPAADLYEQSGKIALSINALLKLAEAYQRLGHYQKALSILKNQALMQAENTRNKKHIAAVRSNLGQVCFLMEQMETARRHLEISIQLAKQTKQPVLQALGLLHLGHVSASQKNYLAAQSYFTQSVQLAQQHDQSQLAIKGLMNQVWIELEKGNNQSAHSQLVSLWQPLQQLPDNHEKAYLLLKFKQFAKKLNWEPTHLISILHTTINIASALKDKYALSQTQGQLGNLYEQSRQYKKALDYTRQARLAAEQVNASRLLYRWEWQIGRLLKAQGKIDNAIPAYQRAKETIEKLQLPLPQLEANITCQATTVRPNFKTVIEPLFLELADLLLQRSQTHSDKNQSQEDMRAARVVVESLKGTELKDYFKDECITQVLGETREIDQIGENTAVFYPILFKERLELLLSLPNGEIQQLTQNGVKKEQVIETVKALRTRLDDQALVEEKLILELAQPLYRWLIQPIVPTLETHQIKTLVVVPRGVLLTIPFAVLHDGKQFLVEKKYALAMTTSVKLTAPNSNRLMDKDIAVLSSGLTEVAPNIQKTFHYEALRLADEELTKLQSLYPNSRHHQLKDKMFTSDMLDKVLKKQAYTLLHITSHAQFTPNFQNTFILTYDDKLTMDKLAKLIKTSKYRKEPLELLTLNACETAKGDERAALGLSGVALKAGARSALATLWEGWDEAAYHLTLNFYEHLGQSHSKAQALQQAQKTLLNSQYKHPYYWSPFILIGNWL
jgi:CHAT domain-containing protein